MTTKKVRLRNKADRLYQEIGRMLNKKCLVCKRPATVTHHFIPKSVCSALRYNIQNGIPLCHQHHCRIHSSDDPFLVTEILRAKGADWFEELCAIRRNSFIKESVEYYENVIKNLERILNAQSKTTRRP
jgi:hypothetical protein